MWPARSLKVDDSSLSERAFADFQREAEVKQMIFKGFIPFAHLIESVSDERAYGDGIWVYLSEPSDAAAGICAPSTLHEDKVSTLVAQLREVEKEK